ncbi:MAG: hypothetical protein AAF497_25475 [Planctomycetota bacterium]
MERQADSSPISPKAMTWIRRSVEFAFIAVPAWLFTIYGPLWFWPRVPAFLLSLFGAAICYAGIIGFFRQMNVAARNQREEASVGSGPRVYSVPRRFGIFTIGLVTFAIAGITTLLQFLVQGITSNHELQMYITGGALMFLVAVSLMQLLMDRVPRRGSIFGGLVYGLAIGLYFFRSNSLAMAISVVVGGSMGYIVGVLVASLFMISETATRGSRPAN